MNQMPKDIIIIVDASRVVREEGLEYIIASAASQAIDAVVSSDRVSRCSTVGHIC